MQVQQATIVIFAQHLWLTAVVVDIIKMVATAERILVPVEVMAETLGIVQRVAVEELVDILATVAVVVLQVQVVVVAVVHLVVTPVRELVEVVV